MKKRNKIILTTISIILSTIVIVFGGIWAVTNHYLNKVEKVEIDRADVVDSSEPIKKEEESIINIALLGTDKTDMNVYTAADSIMILTLNSDTKEIKLTSLMRDMYLDVPGYGMGNLNDTIITGGPSLLLKTINTNFGLRIDKFIQVNLKSLETIIDKLGGVTINIQTDEVPYVPRITAAGTYNLDGEQAVAYSRIRVVGRDFERTRRQRDVLTSLYNKFRHIDLSDIPSLASEILPFINTNLTNGEILSIATKGVTLNIGEIQQHRFPMDEDLTTAFDEAGVYHMYIDKEATKTKLQKIIYSN